MPLRPDQEPFPLDPERCYQALRQRDVRFDGRFFTGVKSTGIFCRPVCPAPPPKPVHCSFWPSAAAAQAAGFRPCLRCRPEAAPGTPAWQGTAASVSRALRLIDAGALDGRRSVDQLALRLGIGARHLRRLFDQHLGATPSAVAHMRRALFAKQMLDETQLSMGEIALAAGFGSQRRFNACMREVYGRSPSALRRPTARKARAAAAGPEAVAPVRPVELSLRYRPPFAWGALLAFLRARAIPGVEAVSHSCYARTVRLPDGSGSIVVRHEAEKDRLLVSIWAPSTAGWIAVRARLRALFDLDADAEAIDARLAAVDVLRGAGASPPGVRVPGAFDGFETALRAVLGQQVSVKGATTLAGRVVERFGELLPPRWAGEPSLSRVFPEPERLVDAPLEALGILPARAEAIRGLARAVLESPSLLEAGVDLEASVARWVALPGIGPWTAQYIAMRVLREPDAFPASDLALRKALARAGEALPSARAVAEAVEGARPYRAYAAMQLWARS